MPLLSFARLVFGVVSLALLAASGWLLWSWWQGEIIVAADGVAVRVRDDWRLWAGGALLAWSFLGRLLLTVLIARADTDPTRAERLGGRVIQGARDAALHVEEQGPAGGPVVILTHGWGLDSTIWFYARRDLSKQFRVIVWDLPGLGQSRARRSISLETYASDLRAIIAAAGGRPVILVGHSIGGMIIQTLARDHPDVFDREVAGVVLLNTTYTNPLRTMVLSGLAQALRRPVLEPVMRLIKWLQPLVWLAAWQSYLSGSAHLANRLGFGRFVTRSQLEHNTLLTTRNPPGVQARGNLAMFRWDATGALAKRPGPLLILAGDRDIVTKAEAGAAIAAGSRARLEIIEGVNHMGFLERHLIYNAEIEAFIRTVVQEREAETLAPLA